MNLQAILSFRAFQKWLEEKESGSIVGYANDPNDCPIARYLRARANITGVGVGKENIIVQYPGGDLEEIPTPPWARRFIARVDRDGGGWEVSRAAAIYTYLPDCAD